MHMLGRLKKKIFLTVSPHGSFEGLVEARRKSDFLQRFRPHDLLDGPARTPFTVATHDDFSYKICVQKDGGVLANTHKGKPVAEYRTITNTMTWNTARVLQRPLMQPTARRPRTWVVAATYSLMTTKTWWAWVGFTVRVGAKGYQAVIR